MCVVKKNRICCSIITEGGNYKNIMQSSMASPHAQPYRTEFLLESKCSNIFVKYLLEVCSKAKSLEISTLKIILYNYTFAVTING